MKWDDVLKAAGMETEFLPARSVESLAGRKLWLTDAVRVDTRFGRRIRFTVRLADGERCVVFLSPNLVRDVAADLLANPDVDEIGPVTFVRNGRRFDIIAVDN
jgi:hypothetical protein